MTIEERHECGHTDAEHREMAELDHLVDHVVQVTNPRVALVVTDAGEVHFASTIEPHEAARLLSEMAERVRRHGSNYVHDHFDRSAAARWN